jgi:hypothetical protein
MRKSGLRPSPSRNYHRGNEPRRKGKGRNERGGEEGDSKSVK